MGRGRPGGNPDFGTKYVFTTNRQEPLNKKVTVRITETMESQLKQVENYREFIREAIAEKLEKMDCETSLQKTG